MRVNQNDICVQIAPAGAIHPMGSRIIGFWIIDEECKGRRRLSDSNWIVKVYTIRAITDSFATCENSKDDSLFFSITKWTRAIYAIETIRGLPEQMINRRECADGLRKQKSNYRKGGQTYTYIMLPTWHYLFMLRLLVVCLSYWERFTITIRALNLLYCASYWLEQDNLPFETVATTKIISFEHLRSARLIKGIDWACFWRIRENIMPVSWFKPTFICLLKPSRQSLRFPHPAANFDLHVTPNFSYGSYAICSYANRVLYT